MNLIKPEENILVVVKCRQCLTGDSMVYTTEGPRRIEDLLYSNFRGNVLTIDNDGKNIVDKVVDIWPTGKKLVYELKLASGEKIKATQDHRIRTSEGWKTLGDIRLGELIWSYEGSFGDESVTKEEAIVMGYFITDGSYSNSTPKFTNINLNYLNEFAESVRSFDVDVRWKKKGNGYDLDVVGKEGHGSNKPNAFSLFLINNGLRGVKAAERVLPNKFLNMNKELTSIMLNRIFAGDGWYSTCGKNKMNEIGIGSPSLEFLHQVSYLLSKFGIHSNIGEVNSGPKQKSKFYKLKFSKIEYVRKFVAEIGIYDKTLRSEVKETYSLKKPSNRVVSIKEAGFEETYDLTTETHHSYIANGILVHNSGFSTGIQAKALHRAYFGKVPEILITSAGQNQSMRVLKKIKSFFNSMPEFMKIGYDKDTQQEIQLENGTVIYSLPANPDACRGFTGDVFLDEYGVNSRKDGDELWEALVPCIVKGYDLIAVSTPKGKNNMFYDLCNPRRDEDGVIVTPQADKIITVPWWDVPHVEKVIHKFKKSMHDKQFKQEFECMFLDGGDTTLFSYEFMMDHVVDNRSNPVRLIDLGPVNSYDGETMPNRLGYLSETYPGGIYMGWDVAITGDGSIVTCFGVTREDVWELIAFKKFTKGTDLTDQVPYVARLANYLGAKKLTVDATGGLGLATYDMLRKSSARAIVAPFKFTPQSKMQEYAELRGKMAQEGFRIPEINECIMEFVELNFNPISGRIAQKSSSSSKHDDWPSSFLCAYAGRKKTTQPSGFLFV
jgi:intein/homing endonuclease